MKVILPKSNVPIVNLSSSVHKHIASEMNMWAVHDCPQPQIIFQNHLHNTIKV